MLAKAVNVNGNPGPKTGEGGEGGGLFSLDTFFLVLVSLATIFVVNRVEPLRRVIKPKP